MRMILGITQDASYQAGKIVGTLFVIAFIIAGLVWVIRLIRKPR